MKTAIKEKSDLQKHVDHIANQLQTGEYDHDTEEGPSGFDYIKDVLDINYVVQADKKTYKSAILLVAFGGPNIWIHTAEKTVKGYWWGDYAEAHYHEDALDIDGACEELFNC